MSSLERKLARRQDKATKKIEKKMAKKLKIFSSLPDNCLMCNEAFDKKSKEHATNWFVNVYHDGVQLYCPNCWEK
jgi:hypothetical protein